MTNLTIEELEKAINILESNFPSSEPDSNKYIELKITRYQWLALFRGYFSGKKYKLVRKLLESEYQELKRGIGGV